MDVLIPQVTVERLVPGKHVSPEDQALAYFSFFDNYPSGGVDDLPELTEIVRFYNRYYWFGLFAKLRRATVGFDAGIEQQGFQLLEAAPAGVDWDLVGRIDKLIAVK